MRWAALILCFINISVPLFAADVLWTGQSGEWQDAANWSSDPALPGSADDVFIVVPNANRTVTHQNDLTTIRSLTLEDRLRIRSGSLTVTDTLELLPGSWLTSEGQFVASGTVDLGSASLNAGTASVRPGVIRLPTLTSFSAADTLGWSASEADSVLDLGFLQTIEGPSNPFRTFSITARRGGEIDLGALSTVTRRNESSLIEISAEGAGTLIDLSGLGDLIGSGITDVTVWDQAEIKWGNLRVANEVNLTLGGTFNSSGLTTVTNGLLAVENGDAAIPDLVSVTNVDNSSLRAGRGSVVAGTLGLPMLRTFSSTDSVALTATESTSLLDLSSLETIDAPDGEFRTLSITAARGASIDLGSVMAVNRRNETSLVRITAQDAGSFIDLSGIHDLVNSGITDITVGENAEIKWGNLTKADQVSFRLGGKFDTSKLEMATNGLIAAENGAAEAPDLGSINNVDSSQLRAGLSSVKPGVLRFPELKTYDTSGSTSWAATESGSLLDLSALETINGPDAASRTFSVTASRGGKIDLSNVIAINQRNASSLIKITARQAGSLIDLSAIDDLTGSGITDINVLQGGEIDLGSLVTADGIDFRLGGVLDTAKLTTVTNGSITAENGEFAVTDLSQVTNVDNSSLTAGLSGATAGTLSLPQLVHYSTDGSSSLSATEVGSLLDLNSLQTIDGPSSGFNNLTISATRGSRVDLSGVATVNRVNFNSKVNVVARDEDSIVDFVSLTETGGVALIEAKASGQILFGNIVATDVEINATENARIVAKRLSLESNAVLTGDGIEGSVTNSAGRIEITEPSMRISGQYLHNGGELSILEGKTFEVGRDYANSLFGSGNDFHHRAGVPGEGPFLATSAAQEITGPVANGTSANPSVSLGNVHVGKTQVRTYGIKNSGTVTALRGATKIVFPGSPADNVLLSGVGAGGDFGPVLPGDTHELSVSVTPETAGPIPEQQVMIDNNFDNVATQVATFTATAYRLAEPALTPAAIDFGIVHVGDEFIPVPIEIRNNVVEDAFSESLNATPRAAGDVASGGSNITGLAPQTSNASLVFAVLDTVTPGNKSGAVILDFDSDGSGTSELGLTSLSSESVSVVGQVNAYANPMPVVAAGAASLLVNREGNFDLDLGVIFQGLGARLVSLNLRNDVEDPADDLSGTWTTVGADFEFRGFEDFSGVSPGSEQIGNLIRISSDLLGSFTATLSLSPRSENETGFSAPVAGFDIRITADVVIRGDFNDSQKLDVDDLDLLTLAVNEMQRDSLYDIDLNGRIDDDDRAFWISSLKGSLLGDADLNGTVQFADFLALSGGFGQSSAGWAGGDFDGNGTTEFADFLTLSGNFGQSGAALVDLVPEPNSHFLLLAVVVALALRQRKFGIAVHGQ